MIEQCLIVEDHAEAQTWMREAVSQAFPQTEVTVVGSIGEAVLAMKQRPDLVILDLGLPDGDGAVLIPQLVAEGAEVVISSVFEDDQHLFPALQSGAKGYVLKDHRKDELVLMLRGILDGQPPLSPAIARRILTHFSDQTATEPNEQVPKLTGRETDILTLLAKGYTVKNAAELLNISYFTAAGYAKAVYRKLNVSSRAEAAIEASRLGYVS